VTTAPRRTRGNPFERNDTMFDRVYLRLRALCSRRPLPALPFTGFAPASARPGYSGAVRKVDLPTLGRGKFWLAPLALLLAVALPAQPPADKFVPRRYDVPIDHDGKVLEVVRAAYHAFYGESDSFDPDRCGVASNSDRVDVDPLIKTALQRRRLVDFILHDRRYAAHVLEAYYGIY
jgi:hypothetical protein